MGDKNYLQIISHQMVLSATKLTALLIYKSRPDIFNDPSGDFISHEEYLLILVQNIVFFCTKEYIVLYKRLYSFVQEYNKMSRRISKRWWVFEKKWRVFAKNWAGCKEIKAERLFPGIGLLILPLLIRLDYYIIVILKQALLKMEDNTMK